MAEDVFNRSLRLYSKTPKVMNIFWQTKEVTR